ncbi:MULTISPECIES: urea ABC transporter ATP-binding subunit UrtE [unclassified Methylobacterium]|uniref:urea ABC transporter ATP-binding subunit UrtE n=1 Tax=unclassified Methylobacterium TaxID=2615210 RepID=UPI0004802D34|nr:MULTISPECIES: urea ABC transporter ATP-binding subunit UrtE [unclassified Methylobacterium]MCC0806130.1 urea ABC transporter ATP-binding subunit UrtE [Methylobacterium sp. W2]MCJ2131509.1 urea ABC transporter ATP-binding subunit UrtE [Methylobacterium sp. E-045]
MLLSLENVTSYYGKTPILKDVGFDLPEGQCLCVLGRNGVGKTTLLRTIMGLTDRSNGEIRISGDAIGRAPTYKRAKYGLGYIPQGRQILPHFTVKENILLGTFARTDGKQEMPELCLSLFPYLAQNLHRKAGLLSGGQQQQLAIARALATNPRILLLDEPTEGIQPNIVAEIGQTLRRLNKEFGITLVLTEQHIKVARKLGDAFLMMENGRIVARGPIGEMTDDLINRHMTI